MNKPLMYESLKDCHYALDLVTDEELDIVADDILLLSEGYADEDLISVFLPKE